MTPSLHRCTGTDLDAPTLYELLRLRVEVFVVEQNCPYPELDGRDLAPGTRHFWLADTAGEIDGGAVVATLRLMEEFSGGEKAYRIGRVCTRKDQRGQGHTTRLIGAALADVGEQPCRLNAQSHLAGLYARHGFTTDGPEFVEDGIPHVPMLRPARS